MKRRVDESDTQSDHSEDEKKTKKKEKKEKKRKDENKEKDKNNGANDTTGKQQRQQSSRYEDEKKQLVTSPNETIVIDDEENEPQLPDFGQGCETSSSQQENKANKARSTESSSSSSSSSSLQRTNQLSDALNDRTTTVIPLPTFVSPVPIQWVISDLFYPWDLHYNILILSISFKCTPNDKQERIQHTIANMLTRQSWDYLGHDQNCSFRFEALTPEIFALKTMMDPLLFKPYWSRTVDNLSRQIVKDFKLESKQWDIKSFVRVVNSVFEFNKHFP